MSPSLFIQHLQALEQIQLPWILLPVLLIFHPQDPNELHFSIDIGCYNHSIAVGLANGKYLGKFEITHTKDGFKTFFTRIEEFKKQSNGEVSVAMEGYNGHARPLDTMVQAKKYKL